MNGNAFDRPLSVTELSLRVKRRIETDPELTSVWVVGEISNVTYHSSGHIYFSLKDSQSVISAVFFRAANRMLGFRLEEGMSVVAFGSVTTYERRGNYQMIVGSVRLEGIGELQKKIDQLKKKLFEEGIFDPSKKRPLPVLPKRIGVVTSPTGAVFRDILKVALNRNPYTEILLAPVKVQGDDAPDSIVQGIETLNDPRWEIDLIIAGRGGGSFEDLMPFNDEAVVRAYASSRVPIISAVGHQIDHPLSDDAADSYAATPSAAAEMAVPVRSELLTYIEASIERMTRSVRKNIDASKNNVESILARKPFSDPANAVYMKEIELSEFLNRMLFSIKDTIQLSRSTLQSVPDLPRLAGSIIERKKSALSLAASSVEQLSPLGVIARGYAIAIDSQKKVVKSVLSLRTGDALLLHFRDGAVTTEVSAVHQGVTIEKRSKSKED